MPTRPARNPYPNPYPYPNPTPNTLTLTLSRTLTLRLRLLPSPLLLPYSKSHPNPSQVLYTAEQSDASREDNDWLLEPRVPPYYYPKPRSRLLRLSRSRSRSRSLSRSLKPGNDWQFPHQGHEPFAYSRDALGTLTAGWALALRCGPRREAGPGVGWLLVLLQRVSVPELRRCTVGSALHSRSGQPRAGAFPSCYSRAHRLQGWLVRHGRLGHGVP